MNALRNPQSAALQMVAALQAVVADKHGMTEDTFRKVLGALNAAGVDPFPSPAYRPVQKVSHYKDGKDWWVHDPKENTYLCGDDGDFARFETEEQAIAAIVENAEQERELQAELSCFRSQTHPGH